MQKLLTTHEAAERMGMSHRNVLTMIERGWLPATRYGHAWLIAPADADAFQRRPSGWPKGRPRKKPIKASKR